jgi:hypothetical protein
LWYARWRLGTVSDPNLARLTNGILTSQWTTV